MDEVVCDAESVALMANTKGALRDEKGTVPLIIPVVELIASPEGKAPPDTTNV